MDELAVEQTTPLLPLRRATLASMPDAVQRPSYALRDQSPGIVHIGLGNFHRAHQAWYLQQLMQKGVDLDWSIIGAGVRPADDVTRRKLQAQDWLTTLIELGPDDTRAEICGTMIGYVPIAAENGPLIRQIADPATRIVSLTVTEGGYYRDPGSGTLQLDDADLLHDAAHASAPKTAFGAIIAGLRERRDRGLGPLTGLSCDNLRGNGDILRETIVCLARRSDADLADWIDQACTFPNSMVDCIVPATGAAELALAHDYGVDDAVPVTHENFRQWVIEDSFAVGRPRLEEVGVTFSGSVHAYESMKLRILNGGHQIIAVPADLLGLTTISDAMNHPLISALLRKTAMAEIVPFVDAVPGMTASDYLHLIVRRFGNAAVKDTVRRVAFDGSSRQPGFLLPSIVDGLKAGSSVDGLALSSALWARYCAGVREDGSRIEANDPQWSRLHSVATAARENPALWLGMEDIYGDLSRQDAFARRFTLWHSSLYAKGVAPTLQAFVQHN